MFTAYRRKWRGWWRRGIARAHNKCGGRRDHGTGSTQWMVGVHFTPIHATGPLFWRNKTDAIMNTNYLIFLFLFLPSVETVSFFLFLFFSFSAFNSIVFDLCHFLIFSNFSYSLSTITWQQFRFQCFTFRFEAIRSTRSRRSWSTTGTDVVTWTWMSRATVQCALFPCPVSESVLYTLWRRVQSYKRFDSSTLNQSMRNYLYYYISKILIFSFH